MFEQQTIAGSPGLTGYIAVIRTIPPSQGPFASHLLLVSRPPAFLIRPGHTRQPLLHHLRIRRHDTTIPPDLILLMLHILPRPLLTNGIFIPAHNNLIILAEKAIDILERPARRLRVEEVDDGHERRVEDGPDDVEFPLQRLDADGRDLHDHEVEGPVRGSAEGRPLGTVGERVDFCRVEPGDALPADAEEDVVEEEEGDGGGGDLLAAGVAGEFVVADEDCDHHVAETLAG